MEMLAFLRDWLVGHVFKTDKTAVATLALRR